MVSTKKFSEFVNGGDFAKDDTAVGIEGGVNKKWVTNLQFSATGDTSERPASPDNPTIRYNTDFLAFEYWDGTNWEQISGGVLDSIQPTANQTTIDNTDPKNPIIGLVDEVILATSLQAGNLKLVGNSLTSINANGNINLTPNGLGSILLGGGSTLFNLNSSTAINAIIDDDTMANATDTNVPTSESIVAYIANTAGGAGGTTGQIQWNNAGTLDGDSITTDGAGNWAGTLGLTGQLNVDNLRLDGNTLSSQSGDLTFASASNIAKLTQTNNSSLAHEVNNTNAGTAARSVFYARNDASRLSIFGNNSTGYTSVPAWQNSTILVSDAGLSNLFIYAASQPIRMATTAVAGDDFVINTSGQIGLGLSAADTARRLDILESGSELAIRMTNSVSNAVSKSGKIGFRHYDTSEEDVLALFGFSTSTQNVVAIGGGSGLQNTATSIQFNCSANNTTTSGTKIGEFTSTGLSIQSGNISIDSVAATNQFYKSTNSTNTTGFFMGVRGTALGTIFSIGDGYIYQGGGRNISINAEGGGLVRIGTANTPRLEIASSGTVTIPSNNLGIGLSAANTARRLDILSTATALGIRGTNVIADSNNKSFYIGTRHYTNAEEDFLGIGLASTSTSNVVAIGGGAAQFNAATRIDFYAAANTTTTTGTKVGEFTSTGLIMNNSVVRYASYTVAGVPSASTSGAGAMIYITNETGGAVPAFSDGTNWRRVTDRAIIS